MSVVAGNDVTNRRIVDNWPNSFMLDSNVPFKNDASVTEVEFYAKRANPLQIIIYRPTGANLKYTVVGKTPMITAKVGLNKAKLATPIQAKKGDVLGWYVQNAGVIAFENKAGAKSSFTNMNGGITAFTTNASRIYSIRVAKAAPPEPEPEPVEPPAEETAPTKEIEKEEEEEPIEPENEAPEGEDIYDEAKPALWASSLVYLFADLVKCVRDDAEKSLEVDPKIRDAIDAKDTAGLFPQSFSAIEKIIVANKDSLEESHKDPAYLEMMEQLQEFEGKSEEDSIFLEAFDSLNQEQECVYGIVRNDNTETVMVTFRGSTVKQDWWQNLQKMMTKMRTPKFLKTVMDDDSDGKGPEEVYVHKGFYDYLFDNDVKGDGEQQFDGVRNALFNILNQSKYSKYKVVVTGHSLGAALATLVAFKLAGSTKFWIPRPVTCISFASPRVGNKSFAEAFKVLEREGFLRHLRVTNQEDLVPALVMTSILSFSLYEHVGMHLNLFEQGYEVIHPHNKNFWRRALYANIIGKINFPSALLKYHGNKLMGSRLDSNKEELSNKYLDEFYGEDRIIGDLYEKKSSEEYLYDFF